jgi:hypothetical protein
LREVKVKSLLLNNLTKEVMLLIVRNFAIPAERICEDLMECEDWIFLELDLRA